MTKKGASKLNQRQHRPIVEPLSPRVLYSADPLGIVADLDQPEDNNLNLDIANSIAADPTTLPAINDGLLLSPSDNSEQKPGTEAVFVDTSVVNYQQIVNSLSQSSDTAVNYVIYTLNSSQSISDVSDALKAHQQLDAIHFITHGEDANFKIGSSLINSDTISTHLDSVEDWGTSLTEEGDILFYGCNLAESSEGQRLIATIATTANADVGASENRTGHQSLKADWKLEYSVGTIDTNPDRIASALSNWESQLELIIVSSTDDNVNGDTSSVANLKADPGPDGISLREAVIAANADNTTHDFIQLSAGTYTLSDSGDSRDQFTDDLDITSPLTIQGDSTSTTKINTSENNGIIDIKDAGDVTLSQLTIADGNAASSEGGGIRSAQTNLTLDFVTLENNTANRGGALYIFQGSVVANDVVFSSNTANEFGGGLRLNTASFTGSQLTFINNASTGTAGDGQGGAAFIGANSVFAVNDSEFSLNSSYDGGGLYIRENGFAFLNNTTFRDNTADRWGGSIANYGTTIIDSSLIDSGVAERGGGVFNDAGATTIADSTLSNNIALGDGGSVSVGSGTVKILRSTITDNTTVQLLDIVPNPSAPTLIEITGSLIARNQTPAGGIASINPQIVSNGYNLADIPIPNALPTDQQSVAYTGLSTTLQNNGGLVETYALHPDSPAIDAGENNNTASTLVDATGRTRDSVNDIGAYEFPPLDITHTLPPPVVTNEDTLLSFSTPPVVDNNRDINTQLQVILSVAEGTLELASTSDLVVQGNNTPSIVIDGLQDDINASLASLEYTPDANVTGVDTLSITSAFTNGTPITDLIPISIIPENDAPAAVLSNNNFTYIENSTPLPITSAIISDIDDTQLESATVTISGNFSSVEDVLAFTNQAGINGSYDSTNGILTLTGSATLASYQTALQSVTYQNSSDNPSELTRGFTFVVNDGDEDSNSATGNISVSAVNDAPVISTIESQPAFYIESNGPIGITGNLSLSDFDDTHIESATIFISSNFANGEDELLFTDQLGISGNYDPATGVMTLTGSATLDDYQTAIATVAYNNTSSNPSTLTRTVSFEIDDGDVPSNILSRDIELTPVNDAPVLLNIEALPALYTEGAPPLGITGNLTLADVDDTNIESATVSISNNFASGEDELLFTDQLGITGNYNPTTGVMTLSGSASLADYQTAITTVAYNNTSSNPSTLTRTVSLRIDDGNLPSNILSRDIELAAVNDAPVLSNIETLPALYTEGAPPLGITGNLTLADVDDTNIESATVSISNNFASGEDELLFTDQLGITGNYNLATGVMTLTGSATVADYQAAISTITYHNTSSNPSTLTRTVSFEIDDGNLPSNTLARDINFTAINNTPLLSGIESTPISYIENGIPLGITNVSVVSDIDDSNIESATVTITGNFTSGEDILAFNDQAGITGSYDAANGILTLTNSATLADYQNAIRSITYHNTSDDPSDLTRTVSIEVSDGDNVSNAISRNIDVTSVNDAPTLSTIEALPAIHTENGTPLGITGNLSIADVDNGHLQSAMVLIASNFVTGEDELLFTDQLGITGNYNSITGVLTLSGNATVADYQTALRSIAYGNTSDNPSMLTRMITFEVSDGVSASNTLIRDIEIVPVNDAPQGTSDTIIINEESTYTFASTDFGYSDPADGHAFAALTVASLPTTGALTLDGIIVAPGQTISITNINAGELVYTPLPNQNGVNADNWDFIVHDNGGTANGGIDQDLTPNTLSISINSVNDEPTGTDSTLQIAEDSTLIFSASDFGFSDVDANNFTSLTVDSIPALGTLSVNGTPVTVGQPVSITDINLGNLIYTPLPNQNGIASDIWDFSVNDDGGSGNGGIDQDQTPNRISIDVTPVNDAPLGTSNTIAINEDAPYTFAGTDFGYSDPADGHAFAALTVASLPTTGALTLDGIIVTPGQTISITNINAGELVYTPLPNQNGVNADNWDFIVHDNGGTANGGIDQDQTPNTLSISINSINDEPAGTDTTLQIAEDSTHIFSASDFGFSDVDGNSFTSLIAETIPTTGTLSVSGTPVTVGQPVSIADINLGNLIYTPLPNQNGMATDTWDFSVIDDGGSANSGIDQDQTPNRISIDVTPVNDAPLGTSNTIVINEEAPYTFAGTDFGYSDPADGHAFAALTVASLPASGALTLNGIAVTPGQTISITNINAGELVYTPLPNQNGVNADNWDFIVHDNGGTANGGIDQDQSPNTLSININSVNDEPAGTDTTLLIAEDSTHIFSASDFGFSDVDANNFTSLTVDSIPALGTLSVNGTPVTVGQPVSITDINLGNLIYTPLPNQNGIASDIWDFSVNDDGGSGNGGIDQDQTPNRISIDVTPVNDAPLGTSNTIAINEDAPHTFVSTDFGYSDPADGHAFAALTVASLPASGALTLDGIAVTPGQTISITNINTGELIYTPLPNQNGVNADNWDFIVHDNGGTANGGIDQDQTPNTITIDINPVNDAPAGSDGFVATIQGVPSILSKQDFGFLDAVESHNFASIIVDAIPATGNLLLAGTAVTNGQTINVAQIDAGQLSFVAPLNNTATQSGLSFRVTDDGGTANGGQNTSPASNTLSFGSTPPPNTPPLSSDVDITLREDTTYTFNPSDFAFSDSDSHGFQAIQIISTPADGTLTLNTTPVSNGDVIDTTDLTNLAFTPVPSESASQYAAFDYKVIDNGSVAGGGSNLSVESYTVSIEVTPVNDPPSASDNNFSISETDTVVLSPAVFGFTDPADQHTFQSVTIVTPPTSGTLQLDQTPVAAGDTVSSSRIANGQLVFTPAPVETATADQFEFTVTDNGGTSNGGIDTSLSANTISFAITADNNRPSGQDADLSILEDGVLVLNSDTFGYSDTADGHQMAGVIISALPVDGVLSLNNNPLQVNDFIAVSSLDADALTYTPEPNAFGEPYASIDFLVVDNGSDQTGKHIAASASTLTISVLPVNDAPENLTLDGSLQIAENTQTPTIGSVVFTDADLDDNHLITVNDDRFEVINGVLTLKPDVTIDFEAEDVIPLQLSVTDTAGATVLQDFIIQVTDVNEAPVVNQEIESQSGTGAFSFAVPANVFFDVDGDPLELSATLTDGSPIPEWVQFDPATREFIVSENGSETNRSISILLTATDPDGLDTSTVFDLTVEPPIAEALPAVPQVIAIAPVEVTPVEIEPALDTDNVEMPAANEEMPETLNNTLLLEEPLLDAAQLASDIDQQNFNRVIQPEADNSTQTTTLNRLASADIEVKNHKEFQLQTAQDPDTNVTRTQQEIDSINTLALRHLSQQADASQSKLDESQAITTTVLATSTTITSSLSVGYILWLLRGGTLVASMMASLPAWRTIDPLPILESITGDDGNDTETLESMVENDTDEPGSSIDK